MFFQKRKNEKTSEFEIVQRRYFFLGGGGGGGRGSSLILGRPRSFANLRLKFSVLKVLHLLTYLLE